jgi:hypothetical protein
MLDVVIQNFSSSGRHVVAVDAASGAVIGGTLGGWSCVAPGPAQFDGT